MPDRPNIYKKISNLFCDSYLVKIREIVALEM